MTQTECYQKLGWPIEGDLLTFVLPLYPWYEDGSTCWKTVQCLTCGLRGIARTEHPDGSPVTRFECGNNCGPLTGIP